MNVAGLAQQHILSPEIILHISVTRLHELLLNFSTISNILSYHSYSVSLAIVTACKQRFLVAYYTNTFKMPSVTQPVIYHKNQTKFWFVRNEFSGSSSKSSQMGICDFSTAIYQGKCRSVCLKEAFYNLTFTVLNHWTVVLKLISCEDLRHVHVTNVKRFKPPITVHWKSLPFYGVAYSFYRFKDISAQHTTMFISKFYNKILVRPFLNKNNTQKNVFQRLTQCPYEICWHAMGLTCRKAKMQYIFHKLWMSLTQTFFLRPGRPC